MAPRGEAKSRTFLPAGLCSQPGSGNCHAKSLERRLGQRFAKEVGMGDPAEENDPPPESQIVFAKPAHEVNRKCDECVTKFFVDEDPPSPGIITIRVPTPQGGLLIVLWGTPFCSYQRCAILSR